MSEVTTGVQDLEKRRVQKTADAEAARIRADAQFDRDVPVPVGYKVLIALPKVEETYGSGDIVKSTKAVRDEYILSMIGMVLDMGAQAYADKDKFPTGPWCAKGDYVLFRANTGTRFIVNNQEFRVMNDDSIEAIVKDPRAITRAGG